MAPERLSQSGSLGSLYSAALRQTMESLARVELDRGDVDRSDIMSHLEESDEDTVVTAVQEELAEWRRCQEDYQLAEVSMVGDDRLESLRELTDSALDRLTTAISEKVLLPRARRYINESRDELESSVLSNSSADGLHQLLPPNFQLQTSATGAVSRIMRQQRTAAIGIAGPRGCGKTTLIEWFTSGSRRQVLVSAPVQYDPRDFVLHLFSEVCHSIVGTARTEPNGLAALGRPRAIVADLVSSAYSVFLRLVLVISGLAVGYASFLLLQTYFVLPLSTGTIQQAAGLLVLSWISANLSFAAATSKTGISPFTVIVNHLRAPDRPLVLLSALAALGSVTTLVLAVRYGVEIDDRTMVLIVTTVSAALVAASSWRLLSWKRLRQPRHIQGMVLDRSYLRDRGKLYDQAQTYLSEIQFQQTFTSGWGGKVTASARFTGAELSSTEGVSLVRSAWTLPETVRNLRDLLAEAARQSTFVIGIDEVDKIDSIEAARRFVDDIKAIFHVPGCFFLVSVSDDAVQSFESRGLPFRDAFDSAFDEVVRVEPGDVNASRDILAGRVVGLPVVFSALCHAVSGGLPRDLLRTTRYLYSLRQPVSLGQAAAEMSFRELMVKMPLMLRSATRLNTASASLVVGWSEAASTMWRRAGELRHRIDALKEVINTVQADGGLPIADKAALLRSCAEAEVVGLLTLTLVEFCDQIDGATVSRESADALGSLAVVRQGLAVHPAIAATRLQEFRREHDLKLVDSWSTDPALRQVRPDPHQVTGSS